jgi:hypothetical protein
MRQRPKERGLKPYLIFGIIAATIEMAVILWLLYG